jgi:hypothetical protein
MINDCFRSGMPGIGIASAQQKVVVATLLALTRLSIDGVALASTTGIWATEMRPHHGHVAGVVEHPVFLLVRRVVFLVDDDQPEIMRTAGTAPNARRRLPR